jgi:hypothetical protein
VEDNWKRNIALTLDKLTSREPISHRNVGYSTSETSASFVDIVTCVLKGTHVFGWILAVVFGKASLSLIFLS